VVNYLRCSLFEKIKRSIRLDPDVYKSLQEMANDFTRHDQKVPVIEVIRNSLRIQTELNDVYKEECNKGRKYTMFDWIKWLDSLGTP
jgi:predicted transcriptional regulator